MPSWLPVRTAQTVYRALRLPESVFCLVVIRDVTPANAPLCTLVQMYQEYMKFSI